MLKPIPSLRADLRGTTMLEILITIVILAFGLLGLAGLQGKITMAEMESYQRGQAILLMNDMVDRINANRIDADNYWSATKVWGTDDTTSNGSCLGLATERQRDLCEWSQALQGVAETTVSGGQTSKVGAMVGARGCIKRVTQPNPATGVCTPGVYRVEVAWQGLHLTAAPPVNLTCAATKYDDERYRRVVSTTVAIGLQTCE